MMVMMDSIISLVPFGSDSDLGELDEEGRNLVLLVGVEVPAAGIVSLDPP